MFHRIIGIDMSIRSTGIVELEPKTGDLIDHHNVLSPDASMCDLARFSKIIDDIDDACSICARDLVIIEDYAFSAKGQITRMAELGGSFKMHIYRETDMSRVNIVRASAGTLKKLATGKGTGPKNQVILGVYKKWGYEAENDDMADAYCAAKLGYLLTQDPKSMHKYELECVKATLKKNKVKAEYYRSEGS